MSKYVPGTGSLDSPEKTYEEVFTSSASPVIRWILRITLFFMAFEYIASWFHGFFDIYQYMLPLGIWAAARCAVYVYIEGVKMGMHYKATGNTHYWGG